MTQQPPKPPNLKRKKSSRLNKAFPKVVTATACMYFLSACGGGSDGTNNIDENVRSVVLPTDSKVDLDVNTMWSEDPAFSEANPELENGEVDTVKLPPSTKLIAMVDRDCQEELQMIEGITTGDGSDFYKLNKLDGGVELSMEVGEFQLEKEMTDTELEKSLAEEICLVKVNNEMEVSTTAVPNDPDFSRQKHFTAINADPAFAAIEALPSSAEDVTIAIIDTGIDYNHPDLKNRMWTNSRGEFGYDFNGRDNDPFDGHFHGTHVAGLAGAESNNNIGVTGVMGARSKLMAVKVLSDNGGGRMSDVANGITYAVDNGADIINLSLGGPGHSSLVEAALKNAVEKGVTVVAAAGNSGREVTTNDFFVPSAYANKFDGVISVGSVDQMHKTKSSFSNFSTEFVEIAAPGSGGIFSTMNNGRYGSANGTSMASPIVAGAGALAIALLKNKGLQVTPKSIEELLTGTSKKRTFLASSFKDGNLLDVTGLLSGINGGGSNPPSPPVNPPNPPNPPEPPTPPAPEPPAEEPANTARIKRWVLMNADTGEEIGTINNEMTISVNSKVSVVAEVEGKTKRHAYFHLNGRIVSYDKTSPYSLFGEDGGGNFKGFSPVSGPYEIKGTPTYLDGNGRARVGEPSTIRFVVQ